MITVITEATAYSQKAIELYNRLGKVVQLDCKNRNELLQAVKDAEILVVRLAFHIDKEIIDTATNLKYIVSPTTGNDHIDINYAATKNIRVVSLKGETAFLNTIPSTAEYTIALLLALIRKVPTAFNHTLARNWNRNLFTGHNLRGKKIGIIGLGRVGEQVATIAKAFGMTVSYYDPYKHNNSYHHVTSLVGLISENDIISIHIPLNNETQLLLSKEILNAAQKDAYIINTSRAGVWDEAAIIEMINKNKIAGIATDVISDEQDNNKIATHPMIACANQHPDKLIITPHIAGATYESMRMTEEFVAEKLLNIVSEEI